MADFRSLVERSLILPVEDREEAIFQVAHRNNYDSFYSLGYRLWGRFVRLRDGADMVKFLIHNGDPVHLRSTNVVDYWVGPEMDEEDTKDIVDDLRDRIKEQR